MGTVTAELYDLDSNLLADISPIALGKSLQRSLSGARVFSIDSIANHALLTAGTAGDGFPNLRKGNRKLVVWEDGIDDPIFHGRVFGVERTGQGEKTTAVKITAIEPLLELGYEGEERAGRVVRDQTGNFINPTFTPAGVNVPATAISGPELIYQVLYNSQGPDNEAGANPGEGPLPIDIVSGLFDLAVPPALDLSVIDTMDWPILVGDFIQTLVQTGVVDVNLRPLAPGSGFDRDGNLSAYVMAELSAVSSFGSDLHASVHFDYATGAKNAKACRHVEDFSTINNKLYDYLGPRRTKQRWKGNITPGSPGTTVDPSASRTLYGGQFMSIRIFDSIGGENASRPLYLALWNAEQGYRVDPRDLLYITPADGDKALFEAGKDFDAGDRIAINTGADFGIELAETQRVYGYTKSWSRENVVSVSELVTSADV